MTAAGPFGVRLVLADGDEVEVGTLRVARGRGAETAMFAYAASYLADPRAYAVDPDLPLRAAGAVMPATLPDVRRHVPASSTGRGMTARSAWGRMAPWRSTSPATSTPTRS